MALALEGTPVHNNASSGTSLVTGAFTTTQAAEIFISVTLNGTTVSSITGGSLTWARRKSVAPSGDPVELWAAAASGSLSGVSFTVNLTGSTTFITTDVFAFSGQDTSTIFDTDASIPASATSSPVTFSTGNANDAIIATFRSSGAAAPTVGTIAGTTATLINTGDFQIVEYRIVSATQTTQTATMGSTSNGALADAVRQFVATAALTGTATASITEVDVVAGGKTIILTLTGDTYVAASGFQTIALRGTGKSGNAINGGNVTLTFDVGGGAPQTGDYVVVFGGHGTTVTTLAAPGAAAPADGTYTQIGIHTGTAPIFGAWIKKMGATPDTKVVCSGGGNAADAVAYGCWVFSGVDLTTPQDATATTAGPTTSTNPNGASITTVTDNAWVVAMAGSVVNDSTPGTISGYTNQQFSNNTDTSPFTASGMTKLIAAHGADDPAAYSSWSSGAWYAITMALRPAATTPFNDARAALITGIDSAQSEAAGWDAKVKANLPVANVVRTSSTVCTVTLQAQSDYNITAQETITATIPATMLNGGAAIVATPTFTVDQTGGAFTLSADFGTYTITGAISKLLATRLITATGSYALTGTTSKLLKGYATQATAGSYLITGATAKLLAARLIKANTGAYTLSGTTASLLVARRISAALGSYIINGADADLAAALLAKILNAAAGSYALSGMSDSMLAGRLIKANSGAYVLAGQVATLLITRLLKANTGSYALSGTTAKLLRAALLQIVAGNYTYTGTSATLTDSGATAIAMYLDLVSGHLIMQLSSTLNINLNNGNLIKKIV